MTGPAEPTDEELVSFAESLLHNLAPHLRERHVLEEAVRHHRGTWLTLYETSAALKTEGTVGSPSEVGAPGIEPGTSRV